MSSTTREKAVE
jgi:hypothetical protein